MLCCLLDVHVVVGGNVSMAEHTYLYFSAEICSQTLECMSSDSAGLIGWFGPAQLTGRARIFS